MLPIEYMKKIDEVLEVEGFSFNFAHHKKLITPTGDKFVMAKPLVTNLNYKRFKKEVYPLYLQRVIEAINRKTNTLGCSIVVNEKWVNPAWWNKKDHGGDYFYYTGEFTEKLKSIKPDLDIMPIDEAKEKAIIYIMDHIKEKV